MRALKGFEALGVNNDVGRNRVRCLKTEPNCVRDFYSKLKYIYVISIRMLVWLRQFLVVSLGGDVVVVQRTVGTVRFK